MEPVGHASIFISYSSKDSAWMERFRQALRGALYEKATVWCDHDIHGGTDWQNRLAMALHRADVALVLATDDYLESEWCRRELKYICGKFREERIKNVFWVQLKPCAWKQTELAAFQYRSCASGRALSELEDEGVRDREVVYVVGEICSAVQSIAASLDPDLSFVQSILGDEAFKRHLSIESLISKDGDFTWVCRGRDASQRDVAIKVLRRTPISGILEDLQATAKRRAQLRDPGFIRLYDSFMVKSPYGEHLVLVTEYFYGKRLHEALADEALKGRFTTDSTVTLVRRAAEALRELHQLELAPPSTRGELKELGYGPMIPKHLFYDQRLERLRFSALSISNYAWEVLGWKRFALLVSADAEPYTAPEQIAAQPAPGFDKGKMDQYMLGQLAVEMLEAGQPAGGWKSTNPQLERIVSRMLSRTPTARWNEMGELVTQLKAVEGEARALAKSSYMHLIDSDPRFFEDFYTRFFASKVAKKAKSKAKFRDRAEQQDKLRKGMAAVLNFYPGNEPTSLRYVVEHHQNKGVTQEELNEFKSCFLGMLKDRLDRAVEPKELVDRKHEVYQAWQDLFDQVLSYFREQGIRGESSLVYTKVTVRKSRSYKRAVK